jgi:hypothetical protein
VVETEVVLVEEATAMAVAATAMAVAAAAEVEGNLGSVGEDLCAKCSHSRGTVGEAKPRTSTK